MAFFKVFSCKSGTYPHSYPQKHLCVAGMCYAYSTAWAISPNAQYTVVVDAGHGGIKCRFSPKMAFFKVFPCKSGTYPHSYPQKHLFMWRRKRIYIFGKREIGASMIKVIKGKKVVAVIAVIAIMRKNTDFLSKNPQIDKTNFYIFSVIFYKFSSPGIAL